MQNIIIIIFILILLNFIKISSTDNEIANNIKNINKIDKKINIKKSIPKYGDTQYYVNDHDIFNYKPYDEPSTFKTNIINNYKDIKKLSNEIPEPNKPIQDSRFKKTNLPCQQDIIYDTRFYDPSDEDDKSFIDFSKINYQDRKIQDVYSDLVNNKYKNIQKKIINKEDNTINGAFGEKTLKTIDWEYENDDDGMNFDPYSSNLLAL